MPVAVSDQTWDPTSVAALVVRQLEGVEAWNTARQQRERALLGAQSSREQRVSAMRRLDVLGQAHRAVLDWAAASLADVPSPMTASARRRAVLVHRHEWFRDKLSDALRARGLCVMALTDNGAEALGVVVAEQPDLLLVGETLGMLTGGELLAETALFAPCTVTAAQVADSDGVGTMLDAGARTVFTRRMPPAEVAAQLVALLDGPARDDSGAASAASRATAATDTP